MQKPSTWRYMRMEPSLSETQIPSVFYSLAINTFSSSLEKIISYNQTPFKLENSRRNSHQTSAKPSRTHPGHPSPAEKRQQITSEPSVQKSDPPVRESSKFAKNMCAGNICIMASAGLKPNGQHLAAPDMARSLLLDIKPRGHIKFCLPALRPHCKHWPPLYTSGCVSS